MKEHPQRQELYGPVIAANNQFAVRFFKAAYESSSQKNVLTAPASLSYAFAVLLNGSAGSGRDQIADLFDLKDIPLDRINQGNAALRAIRKSHPIEKSSSKRPLGFNEVVGEDGWSFQPYRIAGALWVPKGAFARSFLSLNTSFYGYTMFPRRPTPTLINHWASLKTHGKLNNIIQDIGDDDFVLATVVDFKSRWVEPFPPSETHPGDFTGRETVTLRRAITPTRRYMTFLASGNHVSGNSLYARAGFPHFKQNGGSAEPNGRTNLRPCRAGKFMP